jgi:hypothetical protein
LFIEANWSVLANVLIRYYKRNTDLVRVARIWIKDNGEGFWMQVRACRRNTSEALWKWEEVKHTDLTPLTACHQNKDYPWIIISGGKGVGRYCKAVNCPSLAEDAETTDLWFTVALARIEMRDGERVTIVDEPRQELRIRQGDLGVVFRTLQERKKEPNVYEKVRSDAARKRKHATDAAVGNELHVEGEVETRPESILDGEVEGPAGKKRKLSNLEAGDEGEAIVSDSNEHLAEDNV